MNINVLNFLELVIQTVQSVDKAITTTQNVLRFHADHSAENVTVTHLEII